MTREKLEERIQTETALAMLDAADDFTRETGADLAAKCTRLAVETARRYEAVRRGEAPAAFGAFDRDEIARVLNADTIITYMGYRPKKDFDPKACKDWIDAAYCTEFRIEAAETYARNVFLAAYAKYLHTAAAFAKSMDGGTAMRLYLRAWRIVDALTHDRWHSSATPNDALRAVNLERLASERLWLDVAAAKLPKFTPRPAAKQAKKPTAGKRRR